MTHSNHRFTTLSADDVALCRAHSEAIASEPDCVVWARITDTKASLAELERKVAYHAACDDFERVTLNQAQSDAYWQWQREVHSRIHIGVDLGSPEGDTTVIALAPAKPAGPQPYQEPAAWDCVHRYGNRAEYDKALAALFVSGQAIAPTPMSYIDFSEAQWDGSPKTGVVGIGDLMIDCGGSTICNGASACRGFETKEHYRDWFRSLRDPGMAAQLASTSSAAVGAALIGAKPSAPAQQPAQKASTHSVCIRAYGPWNVSEVAWWNGAPQAIPANWLPCDESGWVTHVPTADAVCPVPDGVDHETKRRNGEILGSDCSTSLAWQLGSKEMRIPHEDDVIAWRPIAQS